MIISRVVDITSIHNISTRRSLIDCRVRSWMPKRQLDNVPYSVICTVRRKDKHNTMRITLNGPSHLVVARIHRMNREGSQHLRAKVVMGLDKRLTLSMVPSLNTCTETLESMGLSFLMDELISKTLDTYNSPEVVRELNKEISRMQALQADLLPIPMNLSVLSQLSRMS